MTMSMYSTTDKMKMSAPSCFPGRYSPSYRSSEQMRRCMPNPSSRLLEDASLLCNSWSARQNGDIFAGINDGILSRAEALAAVDIQKHQAQHVHSQMPSQIKHDVMYHHHSMSGPPQRPLQMHHSMDQLDMLDPTGSMTTLAPISESPLTPTHQHLHGSYHSMNHMMSHHHPGTLSGHTGGHHGHSAVHHPVITAAVAAAGLHPDTDTDPRELEAFAERFKQRRIKLVALKPILQAWLEEAEAQAKNKRRDPDAPSVLPAGEKKRTSIAAPEKRSLEAYFAVQPRPSGEKIAAIAEKLDLKKNVVRVWFCNQRQKQKRIVSSVTPSMTGHGSAGFGY
ncbi:uncharacterized protein Dyak_GE16054 [Drosophila yakuba]|uniref:Homeobox domain-containing protein n=1 Tax=Drosophila yakuba TaxID=7245 RepID=B4PWL9_DROYA|nr:uncharacterized protein Dyak_GE16054 [Drosophila yakuba]